MDPVQTASLAAESAGSMTILEMFHQADLVVKSVMLALLAASVWCWAIIINKATQFKAIRKRTAQFEDAYIAAANLDYLHQRLAGHAQDPMGRLFCRAMDECLQGRDAGLTARVERLVRVQIHREMEKLERSLPFLATVGSVAPFVGLFGTVWGIMNSFSAIAGAKNTSLAIVAPGIAEALFATALGLIAAIPAVMAYNKFSNDLGKYAARMEAFGEEFIASLTRHPTAKAA